MSKQLNAKGGDPGIHKLGVFNRKYGFVRS